MDNSVSSSIALPLRKAEVSHGLAFALMSGLFFMIGFLTSLNTILVPHLKSVFDLSYMVATLVQFAFFLAYFSLSLPIGLLIGWAGYKRTLMIGLLLCSLGCVLFLPAASYLSYPLFLGGLFILASGVTTLEVAGNPYVAVLGRWKNASSRLNLVHVFDSLGTVIGPIFAATFFFVIAGEGADPVARADAVKGPYLVLAITLIVLAVALAAARLPRLSDGHTEDAHAPAGQAQTSTAGSGEVAPGGSLWRYPHLVLGTLSIFIYVGCEVSVGSFLVSFLVQPNIGNMSAATAAHFVAFYWGGAMIGRLDA